VTTAPTKAPDPSPVAAADNVAWAHEAAIDLRDSTGGFALGGLSTTLDAEVLHVNGGPISGLFAAGRSATRAFP
jgi:hypothetical protein